MRRVLLGVFLAVLAAAPARAELAWRALDGPPRPAQNGLFGFTYDTKRDRMVMLGGFFNQTWTFAGGTWTRHEGAQPPDGALMSMAHHAGRDEVVMFGGGDGAGFPAGETWSWDGEDWTQRATPPELEARRTFAMVYDPVRREVVLFGGLGGDSRAFATSYPLGDTWVWNGTWTKRTPTASPSARFGHAMAWDPAREEVVLFGGDSQEDELADTWVWDGTTWRQRAPAQSPPKRSTAHLAFDRKTRQMVLFGGADIAGFKRDTWVWDGANWIEKFPPRIPDPRILGGFEYDPVADEPRLFYGFTPHGGVRDIWAWTGSEWVERTIPPEPPLMTGPAMAFDAERAEAVLFGGDGNQGARQDTWLFDGAGWRLADARGTKPPPRSRASMTYDEARRQVVLFGGGGNRGALADTWLWNGTRWAQHAAAGPSARDGAAMAFDPVRRQVVLFGGIGLEEDPLSPILGPTTVWHADTWTFDGTEWRDVSPTLGPSGRWRASMAWDAVRKELVLFGGSDAAGANPNDTWAWTGSAWVERPSSESPAGGPSRSLVTDPGSGRVLLLGAQTHEWQGNKWAAVPATGSLPARERYVAVTDSLRSGVLLFGGDRPLTNDTWRLAPAAGPPVLEASGPADGGLLSAPHEIWFRVSKPLVRSRTAIDITGWPDAQLRMRDGERTAALASEIAPVNGTYSARLRTVTADGEPFGAVVTFRVEDGRVEVIERREEAGPGAAPGPRTRTEEEPPPGTVEHIFIPRDTRAANLRVSARRAGRRVLAVTIVLLGGSGERVRVSLQRGSRTAARRTVRLKDGRARIRMRAPTRGTWRVRAQSGTQRARTAPVRLR